MFDPSRSQQPVMLSPIDLASPPAGGDGQTIVVDGQGLIVVTSPVSTDRHSESPSNAEALPCGLELTAMVPDQTTSN